MKRMIGYFLFIFTSVLLAQTQDYSVSMSTARARPLSMGGAFVAQENQLSALNFNPAGFRLQSQMNSRFYVFYNPLGIPAVLKNRDLISNERFPVHWILQGIGYNLGIFSIGILAGEENLNRIPVYHKAKALEINEFTNDRNISAGISLALAPRVSVGVAAEALLRQQEKLEVYWAYRYGIILKPKENLSFGLCYFDLPDELSNDRVLLDRLTDESLNVGLSWSPFSFIIIAGDVRNVSDDKNGITREPHAGIELKFSRHLALRGGYFTSNDQSIKTWSMGVGLIDVNSLVPQGRRLIKSSTGINLSWIIQQDEMHTDRWLIVSSQFYF